MAYTVINSYLPASKYSLKAPYAMTPTTVTIHNTYNDATAINEVNYMKNNSSVVGYHTAIDDKHVVHGIPYNRNAFHAGDGAGAGNRRSIGIEICYSKSGGPKYTAAEENAVQYVAQLLKSRGWGVDKIRFHRDWSGKNCPHRMIANNGLQKFKSRVEAAMRGTSKPTTQDPGSRSYLMRGDTGWRVESLQKYLNDINMGVKATGIYDEETEAMVRLFQSRKGLDPDGFYGPATLAAMNVALKEHAAASKPEPTPKPEEKEDATVASNDGKNELPSKSLVPEFVEAVKEGITDGTYPNRAATRAEVAVMIIRAVKLLRKK